MGKYRPPGFDKEQIKFDASSRYDIIALLDRQKNDLNFSATPVLLDALIDATADAMLAGLRKECSGNIGTILQGEGKGVLVFIPDDE